MVIFCDTLPKILSSTIGFNTEGERWDKIPCPFSRTIQGWAIGKKVDNDNGLVQCSNNGYTPKSIISHYKSKTYWIYYYATRHYLSLLYCNDVDEIWHCVSVSYLPMSYPHSDCDELRNLQMSNQNTSDSEVSVNSNNEAISIESMNEARSLEIDWVSQFNNTHFG